MVRNSDFWKEFVEENLPYGWVHTHISKATNKGLNAEYRIGDLCKALGRHRRQSPKWKAAVDAGIDYTQDLGYGIVYENIQLPSGKWIFPLWVRETKPRYAPIPLPVPQWQHHWEPVRAAAPEDEMVHGGPVTYRSVPANAPRSWRPSPLSLPPAGQQAGEDVFTASDEANFFTSSASSVPAPPVSNNDCAMTFSHPKVVNPWLAAAKPLPPRFPASNEANFMTPALPEQFWLPENPFPASHEVPFFSPPPAAVQDFPLQMETDMDFSLPASVPPPPPPKPVAPLANIFDDDWDFTPSASSAPSPLPHDWEEFQDSQMDFGDFSVPASAPADVNVDAPMSNEDFLAGFGPAVHTDPVLEVFAPTGLTDAEYTAFASTIFNFDM
ncbi:hypothetical protein HBI70_107880 [Parastagonospora nodorum]|nr:hypothetical protein HBI95_126430 [Parastagonospora nodorum]KAH4263494.1 hypothetical protein HBI03_097760 [Parastagonospora nodorum]KAH4271060.1 hypothetical protein HBI04_150950 [Parastagonospora nodorum]KAH5056405.1 hypothetical protein HBH96_118590 [Parastagonospora nodorum]KAH5273627.1 hypothetical protein HBI70_107880 [Parastagonospora nodorum]